MKKKLITLIVIIITIASCTKNDEIIALLNEIKNQNNDLKTQVAVLQKRTDSLVLALNNTNLTLNNLDKKVDSIKNQLTIVLREINTLNIQLSQTNNNIIDIQKKLTELQNKCENLTNLLNSYINSVATASLKDGLVAHYPFTGNANDSSGLANHGTVNGASLSIGKAGIPNTAYLFNGTTNTIDLNKPFLGGQQVDKFTFSTRVKFNSTANTPNIWGKTLFWGEVNLSVTSENSIQLQWANSFSGNKYSVIYSDKNVIKLNTWHDIVVVFENTLGKIYLDGELIKTNLYWVAQGGQVLSNTKIESVCNFAQDSNSSKFGQRFDSNQKTGFLNGLIDDFRVYNRGITDSEVQLLHKL